MRPNRCKPERWSTKTLSRNLQKPSLIMHTKFVASTNPPRPDLLEKVRKRARGTQDEGQDERRKVQSASGHLESNAIKADDEQAFVVPRTGSGIVPNRLQTRRGLKDWARQRILHNEAEAKKRRLNGPKKQDGKEADVEDNRTALGLLRQPERMHALSTGFSRSRKHEKDAIARILTVSRKPPEPTRCRGPGALE